MSKKYWKLNGKYHREDGPAIETANGAKYWYFHGGRHRVDGPAIQDEVINGKKYHAYYINGKFYDTHDKWFQALTPKQQENYLWKLDE